MTYFHTPHVRPCVFILASHLILYSVAFQRHCALHPSIRQCWEMLGAVTPGWEGHTAGSGLTAYSADHIEELETPGRSEDGVCRGGHSLGPS